MSLLMLTAKRLLERFTKKKNAKKQIKESLELKKLSREKVIKYMLNGKVVTIILAVGLIKRTWYK